MKPQKIIAVIMVLASSAVTAWASVDIAYPAILCMLGLLGLSRRFTWNFKPERRIITSLLMLVLAIFFALHYSYTRPHSWVAHELAMSLAWQTVARYFLAGMILMLFLGSPRQLPASLGLFHLASTICAGQVLLLNDRFIAFRLLELFSAVLVVLYAATTCGPAPLELRPDALRPREDARLIVACRRRMPRWAASALILVVAANAGWIISSILYRHVELLEYLPAWFGKQVINMDSTTADAARIAFSTTGRLSSLASVLEEQDTTVVLEIESEQSPGYLRGRAFEVYRQSQWHDLSYQEAVFPQPGNLYISSRTNIFRLHEEDASGVETMMIRHALQFDDAAFAPLDLSYVEAPFKLLLRDDDDIIYTPKLARGKRYRVACLSTPRPVPPQGMQRSRSLDVPASLDPRVEQLANRIFSGCDSTAEKIAAVVRHFQKNYTYAYDPQISAGRDRLTSFLLEGSQGYCEYFASGAAILLRLAGVPTRYVVGFLVTERDSRTRAWIARNMDAHAWVEAWDEQENRWVTVEATAQSSDAAAAAEERADASGDATSVWLGQFLHALYEYGLLGALSWLFTYHGGSISLLALAVLSVVALWWGLSRRCRRTAGPSASRYGGDPSVAALHRMLARMDRRLGALGVRRPLTETLHAFAGRLRIQDSGRAESHRDWARVSDWYVEYANLRYGGAVRSEHVESLRQRARGLQKSL
ncbi:MAG: transglutaminase domain-containing protein [Phycisphaerae bacterium]|nr:transglutaminase domain-containing protein [Phycisphaerae bacterium]